MDPLTLGLIGSLAGTAGAVFNNRSNQQFSDRMSGTSYQRAVKDLKAAGLNPALAYGHGGASTPTPSTENPGAGFNAGISNAISAKLAKEQIETAPYQRALLHTQQTAAAAQGTASLADADQKSAQARLLQQDFAQRAELFPASKRRELSEALLSEYSQAGALNEKRFNELMGMALPGAKAVAPLLGPLGSLIRRKPVINRTSVVNVPRTVYRP